MKLKDITCISDLYYVIGHWFTILMFTIAIWTLPFTLSIYDSVWSFLMCGALAFVGTAPHFRDKFEGRVHYVAAFTSAVCSCRWILNVSPNMVAVFLLFLLAAAIDVKRKLLWVECGCFAMVYLSIVIRIF